MNSNYILSRQTSTAGSRRLSCKKKRLGIIGRVETKSVLNHCLRRTNAEDIVNPIRCQEIEQHITSSENIEVLALASSVCGREFAAACGDKCIRIFRKNRNTYTSGSSETLSGHSHSPSLLVYCRHEQGILASASCNEVIIWDTARMKKIKALPFQDTIASMTFYYESKEQVSHLLVGTGNYIQIHKDVLSLKPSKVFSERNIRIFGDDSTVNAVSVLVESSLVVTAVRSGNSSKKRRQTKASTRRRHQENSSIYIWDVKILSKNYGNHNKRNLSSSETTIGRIPWRCRKRRHVTTISQDNPVNRRPLAKIENVLLQNQSELCFNKEKSQIICIEQEKRSSNLSVIICSLGSHNLGEVVQKLPLSGYGAVTAVMFSSSFLHLHIMYAVSEHIHRQQGLRFLREGIDVETKTVVIQEIIPFFQRKHNVCLLRSKFQKKLDADLQLHSRNSSFIGTSLACRLNDGFVIWTCKGMLDFVPLAQI